MRLHGAHAHWPLNQPNPTTTWQAIVWYVVLLVVCIPLAV
jgi:hypothetical protein